MHIAPYFWFFAALVYLVSTLIFLRSERLVGIYKWVFSLAYLPAFLFLMFANIWIADHAFPGILEWQQNLVTGGASVAFFVTALVPVTVCWLWYALFVYLSRLSDRKR